MRVLGVFIHLKTDVTWDRIIQVAEKWFLKFISSVLVINSWIYQNASC